MKKLIIFLILMINIFSESKKILIIGSYHKEYQFQIEYINEIKNVVGKNYDYFNFYMDTKHIKKEEFREGIKEGDIVIKDIVWKVDIDETNIRKKEADKYLDLFEE